MVPNDEMMFNQEVENDKALKTRPLNKYNLVIRVNSKSRWNDLFYIYTLSFTKAIKDIECFSKF